MAIQCMKCACSSAITLSEIPTEKAIRRRKKCEECGHEFTTMERAFTEWKKRGKSTPEEVKRLRKSGMTYRQISEMLGCSYSYAWNLGEGTK